MLWGTFDPLRQPRCPLPWTVLAELSLPLPPAWCAHATWRGTVPGLAAAILCTSAWLLHTGRLQWKLCACRTAQGPGLFTPHHILRWATPAFESGSNFKISHVLIPQAWFHLINKLCFQGPTRLLPLVALLPKPILPVSANRTLFPTVTQPSNRIPRSPTQKD